MLGLIALQSAVGVISHRLGFAAAATYFVLALWSSIQLDRYQRGRSMIGPYGSKLIAEDSEHSMMRRAYAGAYWICIGAGLFLSFKAAWLA
jgi:hypothetical protein